MQREALTPVRDQSLETPISVTTGAAMSIRPGAEGGRTVYLPTMDLTPHMLTSIETAEVERFLENLERHSDWLGVTEQQRMALIPMSMRNLLTLAINGFKQTESYSTNPRIPQNRDPKDFLDPAEWPPRSFAALLRGAVDSINPRSASSASRLIDALQRIKLTTGYRGTNPKVILDLAGEVVTLMDRNQEVQLTEAEEIAVLHTLIKNLNPSQGNATNQIQRESRQWLEEKRRNYQPVHIREFLEWITALAITTGEKMKNLSLYQAGEAQVEFDSTPSTFRGKPQYYRSHDHEDNRQPERYRSRSRDQDYRSRHGDERGSRSDSTRQKTRDRHRCEGCGNYHDWASDLSRCPSRESEFFNRSGRWTGSEASKRCKESTGQWTIPKVSHLSERPPTPIRPYTPPGRRRERSSSQASEDSKSSRGKH